ncbi:MAG TPA: peptidyl-prolyl cis-trans isomerase [Opitutaceae bacterium]|nr:peptidyl-prolyl cis-trans isomerase [Opitutaceae bacterium]
MMLFGPRYPRFFAAALALGFCLLARAQEPAPAMTEQQLGEKLNLQFANGIAAIAEEKVITVDDLRRQIMPLIPELQRRSRSREEFESQLTQLQEEVLQELIDRVLIVKEFYKDEKRRVPPSIVDNQIAETIISEFDGDRSKYLAYLRSRGMSQKEFRREQEEDIIYNYMRQQQRKSASTVSPVQIETFYNENKDRFYQEDSVYLRLIQIAKTPEDTAESLQAKADDVMKQLNAGGSFADIARLYSTDSRRTRGGDWGWQRRSDLRKEFSEPLFALEKGQYTQPIVMDEGVFILYVEDRKRAGILPLDEVRDQIERQLVQQNARQAQERWLERLRRNGYVKHF